MNDLSLDPLAIDLSVDFDFFVREDVNWDFGHQDNALFASSIIWRSRYATIDLYRETSPLRYADFPATQLVDELDELFGTIRPLHFGWADSHAHAFKFFTSTDAYGKEQAPPGMLINIDAHHDGWTQRMATVDEPLAENWALHLQKDWGPLTQFVQCYPKWKDPQLDGANGIGGVRVADNWHELTMYVERLRLRSKRYYVRNVFLCASQSWVPPHHDGDFIKLLTRIAKRSTAAQQLEGIRKREAPSRQEADELLAESAKLMKQLEGSK